ncbi:hypothetical protein Adt_18502 [Abeliophyllum distichum]|uniref:Putative plant transposon protein domain-containing protein n=1 Tax=Abeliophyllum distichum TaxID=126358 RepID=A0ABD1TJK1_9LAMI
MTLFGVEEDSKTATITNWNDVIHVIYPVDNPEPWPQDNVVRHGDMSEELCLLHNFMATNIAPTSHLTEIYPARIMMLYQLATGRDLNFGEHIFNSIRDLAFYPWGRSKLIFPYLIFVLYKQAKVSMHPSEKNKTQTPILYLQSVRHSVGQVQRHVNE